MIEVCTEKSEPTDSLAVDERSGCCGNCLDQGDRSMTASINRADPDNRLSGREF